MSFQDILGQDSAVHVLKQASSTKRLASAYLFDGPSGVGKKMAALAFAEANLCAQKPGQGCGTCALCQRIESVSHPDVRIWGPREEGARNLPVEIIREEILPFARFAPFEGAYAFVVIDQADIAISERHPEAANVLLKTLEEPKSNLHFILIAERPQRLLQTVRSRCQRVRFNPLSEAHLDTLLKKTTHDATARAVAISLSDGSAERAFRFVQSEHLETWQRLVRELDASIQGTTTARLRVAEELAKRDDAAWVLQLLVAHYRDQTRAQLENPKSVLSAPVTGDTPTAPLSIAQATRRAEAVHQCLRSLERNANLHIALDGLLWSL